jgi:hypothetical protein
MRDYQFFLIKMIALIARRETAIRWFSGFPAVSLPHLRFDRKVTRKILIRNDFSVRGEPREKFYPEFP